MPDAPHEPDRDPLTGGRPISSLPSARSEALTIAERLAGRKPALFLDYDGTLSAIAAHPELALLNPEMRDAVLGLAERCFVAVISGRDLEDVRAKVGIEDLVYAGSHGFDISGPPNGNTRGAHPGQAGEALLPALDAAEAGLRQALGALPGLLLERKRYSLAVHVRQVETAQHERVARAVDDMLAEHPALALVRGKMVYELRPAIDWNKGRAMQWLLRFMEGERGAGEAVVPIYIGDDITDEDAFRALHELDGPSQTNGGGIGIVVGGGARFSLADYVLERPEEVRDFLVFLLRLLEGASPREAAAALAG